MTHRRQVVAAGAALCAFGPGAFAQPAGKAVRIVVPFPAGGGTDAVARLLAEKLRRRYASTILVDNRVGGGGRVGAASVKSGDADGSLMLFTPDFPLTLYPHIYRKMSYELRDFAPVAVFGVASMAVVAGPALPATVRTVADLVQWAKAHPNEAAYASPSTGSTAHFAAMMLGKAAGVELLHVPYKGGPAAVQDLMGGQVPMAVVPVAEILPYVAAGKLRVLATTGPTRSHFLPDVSTLVESGYRDLVVQSWVGMFVPVATPADIVARLNAELSEALQAADIVEALARVGFESTAAAPAASFATLVHSDFDRWKAIVKTTGFSAED